MLDENEYETKIDFHPRVCFQMLSQYIRRKSLNNKDGQLTL